MAKRVKLCASQRHELDGMGNKQTDQSDVSLQWVRQIPSPKSVAVIQGCGHHEEAPGPSHQRRRRTESGAKADNLVGLRWRRADTNTRPAIAAVMPHKYRFFVIASVHTQVIGPPSWWSSLNSRRALRARLHPTLTLSLVSGPHFVLRRDRGCGRARFMFFSPLPFRGSNPSLVSARGIAVVPARPN